MNKIIVAIDGFSSCGKSTMAKNLAKKIGYIYIDSGAIYRAVTLYCLQNGLINNRGELDKERLEKEINNIHVSFKFNKEKESSETYLNGDNVESIIRGMEVSKHVSLVSSVTSVRRFTDNILQQMSISKGVVMDGRDIGTAVFPNAELKIFVTAQPTIRAQRRLDELREKGDQSTTFEDVISNLEQRDKSDQNRSESPLRKAPDAIELDNSHLSKEDQMNWLLEQFNNITK